MGGRFNLRAGRNRFLPAARIYHTALCRTLTGSEADIGADHCPVSSLCRTGGRHAERPGHLDPAPV